jgi:hypothetical protein
MDQFDRQFQLYGLRSPGHRQPRTQYHYTDYRPQSGCEYKCGTCVRVTEKNTGILWHASQILSSGFSVFTEIRTQILLKNRGFLFLKKRHNLL